MFMKSTLSKFTCHIFSIYTLLICLTCATYAQAGDVQTLFHEQFDESNSNIVKVNATKKQHSHGIEAIGIERTACYGTCPAYSFIVKQDGSFNYKGENYVEHVGEFTGTIPTFRLKKVLQAIDALNYASLAMQYTSDVTDMPAVYTMVVQNGQTKVIENYANVGPAHLWAIEELIDSLIEQINWDEAVSADSY